MRISPLQPAPQPEPLADAPSAITAKQLLQIMPGITINVCAAWLSNDGEGQTAIDRALTETNINTPLRKAAFLAYFWFAHREFLKGALPDVAIEWLNRHTYKWFDLRCNDYADDGKIFVCVAKMIGLICDTSSSDIIEIYSRALTAFNAPVPEAQRAKAERLITAIFTDDDEVCPCPAH